MSRPTPWREAAYAVVDVETTGLDPRRHEVLSVGVVPVDGARIRLGGATYATVRPVRAPEPASVVVHGIRPVEARSGLDPAEAARQVGTAIGGRVLVAHVAWVERSFLLGWLREHGIRAPRQVVDTDLLTRWCMAAAGQPVRADYVPLEEAVAWFGLPPHRAHHALGDALATAQLLLAAATRLSAAASGDPPQPLAVADLLAADRALGRLRHERDPNPSGGRWRRE